MKKILAILLMLMFLMACNKPIDKNSKNFNFILGFDFEAKNILNTYNGTFTKDLVPGSAITKLKLSKKEMTEIYNGMTNINIFNLPNEFNPPKSNVFRTPYYTYYLKVSINGKVKELHWRDEYLSEEPTAVKLRDLFLKIKNFVFDKEEYKKMPSTKGGYD